MRQKLLSKYQAALNDDSISVGTIDTTSSYRHEASRRVTSLPRNAGIYDDLLSVDSEAIARYTHISIGIYYFVNVSVL